MSEAAELQPISSKQLSHVILGVIAITIGIVMITVFSTVVLPKELQKHDYQQALAIVDESILVLQGKPSDCVSIGWLVNPEDRYLFWAGYEVLWHDHFNHQWTFHLKFESGKSFCFTWQEPAEGDVAWVRVVNIDEMLDST